MTRDRIQFLIDYARARGLLRPSGLIRRSRLGMTYAQSALNTGNGAFSFNLGDLQSFIVKDDDGTAILTLTDGGAGADTLQSGVGLQLYAATAGGAGLNSTTLLTMGSTPTTLLAFDSAGTEIWANRDGNGGWALIGGGTPSMVIYKDLQLQKSVSYINNIATAGLGVPAIYGSTLQKNETGVADNNVLTYTPAAAAGQYRISFVLDCSASTAGIAGWTATWTDSNGHAQAPANLELYDTAVLLGAFTFTLVANHTYRATCDITIDNSGTNIVVKMTYTSGTLAAKVTASIERIA